jgi:hypothetical protein
MWRRVALAWTDVSEERVASIFRVEKSASEEPVWEGGFETSVHTRTTRRHIQENGILHSHLRENLKNLAYVIFLHMLNAVLQMTV